MIETSVGPFTPERRMLIDGKLVEAASGKLFDNINPATEEVLGSVADAGHEDMAQAIAAARRAFDETDWATDHAFRRRCLEQLQVALESDREQMRAELVAEAGTPVAVTMLQLDSPLEDAPPLARRAHRAVPMGAATARREPLRGGQQAEGGEGTAGCRRRDHPVELPVRGDRQQARPDPRHGQHGRREARTGHPLERHPPRPAHRRAHRHPRRRGEHRYVLRPPGRRGPHARPAGRPDLVHRLDGRPASGSWRRAPPRSSACSSNSAASRR